METCPKCNKTFTLRSNLNRHMKTHLDKTQQKQFVCNHCEKNFNNKFNANRHILKCERQQEAESQNEKVKCSLCDYKGSRRKVLEHYTNDHEIDICIENLRFDDFSDFENWKSEMEKENVAYYVKCKSTKLSTKVIKYYRCHRDGSFRSSGNNIRRLKVLGSNKINGYCPAKMDVTVMNDDGKVSINFLKTHIGHQMELNRIPLKKEDRDFLARKIRQKMSFDAILNSVRNDEQSNERLRLLTRKDLYNIEKLYNLNASVKSAATSNNIDSWIVEMHENNNESLIRFHKRKGEENIEYPELDVNDFLLLIMNDAQLEILQNYGNDCICIDKIHGLTKYEFEFTTLMILDDLQQAFPCLFIFSNRSDTIIFKITFQILKSLLKSTIATSILMSDVAECYHDAWAEIMGPVECQFFCTWHLLYTWKKGVTSKIKNSKKQLTVYNILKTLLEQHDEVFFKKVLNEFMANAADDSDIKNFRHYFAKSFCSNQKFWAFCYRKQKEIDFNMNFEKVHKTLKIIYFKNKNKKRLVDAINALMEVVENSLKNRSVAAHDMASPNTEKNLQQDDLQDGNIIVEEMETCCIIPPESTTPTECNELIDQDHAPSGNLIVRLDDSKETEIALLELPICISDDSTVEMNDLQRYQCKLIQQFYSIVESVNTLDKCKYFETVLSDIEKNLATIS